jgi:hypothetical protein
MTKKQNIVVAISSDHHTNSTIGLCKPYVELDDGGQYKSSKAQRWLWQCWNEYVEKVKTAVNDHDAKLVSVFNGDIFDGDHHNTSQIITRNESTMLKMAHDVTRPLVDVSDAVYVVRGTEAHVGKSAGREEMYADDIGAIRDKETGSASWWHLPLNVNGVTFDIAHHGSLGRLPWTKPNATNRIAAAALVAAAEAGAKPPNLVLRSHLHQYADSGQNYSKTRVISLPGWQIATAYVQRIAPGALADVGGLIVTCKTDGSYFVDVVRFRPTARKAEKVVFND